MSRYLINTVETYRVDSEKEAAELINEAKRAHLYSLTKYSSIAKEVKQKGEIIDTYYKVSLTKAFTNEKEPKDSMEVHYCREGDFEIHEN